MNGSFQPEELAKTKRVIATCLHPIERVLYSACPCSLVPGSWGLGLVGLPRLGFGNLARDSFRMIGNDVVLPFRLTLLSLCLVPLGFFGFWVLLLGGWFR